MTEQRELIISKPNRDGMQLRCPQGHRSLLIPKGHGVQNGVPKTHYDICQVTTHHKRSE